MREIVVVALAGCYAPSAATGVECSANNTCPEGQTCNLVTRVCDGVTPPIDGADGTDAPLVLGPWGAPIALGDLNTAETEGEPSMTADGLELYFVSNREAPFSKIFIAKRETTTDEFDRPESIGFASTSDELGPDISADGLELHFGRAQFFGVDLDIFRVARASRAADFGMPQRDASLSDQMRDDRNPTIAANGRSAMVDVELSATDRDLHYFTRMQATGAWTRVGRVSELATMVVDAGAVFVADGNTIYFHSNRNGRTELYTTSRQNKNQPFDTPVRIEELGEGGDPWVSADQRTIVFARNNDLFIATR